MSTVVSYTAGMVPTAAQFQSTVPVFARKNTDETIISNSTLQNDDDLFWPVEASRVYELELHLAYNSGTTPDMKLGWTFPTGLTLIVSGTASITTGGGATFIAGQIQTTVISIGGTGADAAFHLWAIVANGTTAGTLQLQWAQDVLTASNTSMKAGSYGKLTQIA